MKFIPVCLVLVYLIHFVHSDHNGLIFVQDESDTEESNTDTDEAINPSKIFEATNEWKEIGNTILPKGLHVRINLETGKKEAKLLEDPAEVDVHSRITSNYQVVGQDVQKGATDNLKHLKDLNDWKEISKSINGKFKSIEEIKESNIEFTSENVLLNQTLDKYLRETNIQKRIDLLSDMEYYVHSIDLANDFFQFGGFDFLLKHLNETSTSLKLAVLNVFGASIQGNLRLKNELFKSDFERQIIVIINNSKDLAILKKSLFVLSTFLRNFAIAQKAFFQSFNGIEVLESLLTKDLVLALKASTLLSDLAIEISTPTTTSTNVDLQIYEDIQFETNIQKSSICPKLIKLMQQIVGQSSLATLFESMSGLAHVCQYEFRLHIDLFQTIAYQLEHENAQIALEHLNNMLSRLNLKDEL